MSRWSPGIDYVTLCSNDARRFYDQAYQRSRDPKLLYNLARVLHQAGRPRDAIPYYEKYIDVGAEGSAEQRKKAKGYLAKANLEASALPGEKRPDTTPVYRKWWLWTIVGVAVAGGAVGLGLGLAARRPDTTGAVMVQPF